MTASNEHENTNEPVSLEQIMAEIEINLEGKRSITNVPGSSVLEAPEMEEP
ncbi:hypothetical protein [Paenibacillus methanolicus]|uniref:Uncharacterized protein n=1 Tax=Paenibacillus methanolicus TaxID=582686 RepID=A0A5S5C5M2_9BACL|nr:hypothetical protein [Paenibacillus methanolicus]TYP74469.1 hypothetical protein BCM02_10513 [Paenibacillus methanolicus]